MKHLLSYFKPYIKSLSAPLFKAARSCLNSWLYGDNLGLLTNLSLSQNQGYLWMQIGLLFVFAVIWCL